MRQWWRRAKCTFDFEPEKSRKTSDRQKQEFQTKVQNNAYLTQERSQQYNRIAKLEQDLQNLGNKLQAELMSENEKNSLQLRDSINAFLKEYNKTKGYSMIISNTGFDNLLYADSIYNITLWNFGRSECKILFLRRNKLENSCGVFC